MALSDFDFSFSGIGDFLFGDNEQEAHDAFIASHQDTSILVRQLRGIGASDADISVALGLSPAQVASVQGETEVTRTADIAALATRFEQAGSVGVGSTQLVENVITSEAAQAQTQSIQAGAALSGATPLAETLRTRQNQTQRRSLQGG